MYDAKSKHRLRLTALLAWMVFAAGLIVQLLAPRLTIQNRAFVMPPLSAQGTSVHPDQIVAKDRRMQLISAILTVSGALGLAYRYRRVLTKRT